MLAHHAKVFIDLFVASAETSVISPRDTAVLKQCALTTQLAEERPTMLSFLPLLAETERATFIKEAFDCKQPTANVMPANAQNFFALEAVEDLDDTEIAGSELLFKQLIGIDGSYNAITDLCNWLK